MKETDKKFVNEGIQVALLIKLLREKRVEAIVLSPIRRTDSTILIL